MRRTLQFALCAGVLALTAMVCPAQAQTTVKLCVPGTNTSNNGNSCPPVAPGSGLPVVPQPGNATGIFHGATVGTSSAQVISVGGATVYLMFYNPSAPGGNTVYCAEGVTAVANAAGTIGIAPGQFITMENSLVDGGAWNCIATGASTPFTYGAK